MLPVTRQRRSVPPPVRIDAPLARLPYFTRESLSSVGNDAELLEGLIRIPSVSADIPQVNRAVRFLRDRLSDDGLFCSVETMPDGREVLFAATVETKKPDVLLSAHLDVVPAQSPDQFVPRRENGRIYGRGASDCKEHCVLAARLMRELKDKVSVGCIFGSDEEMGGTSTSFMLDGGYGAKRLVIVMDSEQYAITTRQKGLAYYRITKTHPPRHGGMVKGPLPNAAVELMKGFQDLAAMFPTHEDGGWRDLVSLVSISGGASKAELTVSLRTADFGSWERLEGLVREKLGGEMTCLRKGDPVRLDEKEPVLCEFRERMRAKWPDRNVDFYHLNSSTDARHLQRLGLPMLIIGVDARGAHSPDEHVILSSLDEHADLIKGYLVDRFDAASRKE